MRKTAVAALLFVGASAVFAQSRFDIAAYTPPAGWQVQEAADHVTFTVTDTAAGTFCMAAIYGSQPAGADPAGAFRSEWAALVAASFEAPGAPNAKRGTTKAGQPYLEASAPVRYGDASYLADLYVMMAGDRMQSVLVVSTSEASLRGYQPQVTAFLASLKYAAAPTTSSAAPAAAKGPVDLGAIKGKGIAGVWMGSTTVMGQYTPEPRWATFYDDGQVFRDIPREGLDGFDRSVSRANENDVPYWATYTWNGSAGSIIQPGVTNPIAIKTKSATQITLGSDVYYKCVEVDGARLQGTWTTYSDPRDPAINTLPVGQKPVITFSKDGSFVDEGIFAAAGTGTYEVKRFSLLLHYIDGRLQKLALTGLFSANPAPSGDIIYLGRGRFNRKK